MANFNYSISLDEEGNITKKVRLIKYNSKILAFTIAKPDHQFFYDSIADFLESVKNCEPEIFEDLTGENIFGSLSPVESTENNYTNSNFANTLTLRIIPEKRSQIRFD